MDLAQFPQGFLKFRRDINGRAFQLGIFVHDDIISSVCNHVKQQGPPNPRLKSAGMRRPHHHSKNPS